MQNCIKLEIELIEATNLKDVRKLFRPEVYATVAAMGFKRQTPTGEKGETNPKWNFHTSFHFSKSEINRKKASMLTIELYSNRKWWPKDLYIGKVEVALNDLHNQRASGVFKTVSCEVKRAVPKKTVTSVSGESVPKLFFSYKFVDTAAGDGNGNGNGMPPCTCKCTLCTIKLPSPLGCLFGSS